MPDPLLRVATADGRILEANVGACQLLGYSPEDLYRQRIQALDAAADAGAYWASRLAGDSPGGMRETRLRQADGTVRAVEITTADLDRSPPSSLWVAIRESALHQRESDLRLQLALDSARMGVWELDIKTKALYWSPELYRHFSVGSTAPIEAAVLSEFVHPDDEEMLRLSVSDIDPQVSSERFRRHMETLRHQGHMRFESTMRARDGHAIPVEVTLYYLRGEEGRAARCIAFSTDISARKAVERALVEAKEQAEAATRAKSAFLANMSHEIRTPLNAIVGMASLLEQQARLRTMTDAADHLLALISDILDLSKIEADQLVLEQVDFQLASIFDHVRSLISPQVKAKGLALEMDYAAAPPPPHSRPL